VGDDARGAVGELARPESELRLHQLPFAQALQRCGERGRRRAEPLRQPEALEEVDTFAGGRTLAPAIQLILPPSPALSRLILLLSKPFLI
jgi:hypothetical protein